MRRRLARPASSWSCSASPTRRSSLSSGRAESSERQVALSETRRAPAALRERIAERERVVRGLFEREAANLAHACHAMGRRLARGGTLIPFGTGAAATDAAHVAVEFMHPVIVGKRALPALAPSGDPTRSSSLAALARPDDIALGIEHAPGDPAVSEFLRAARELGLLTVAM